MEKEYKRVTADFSPEAYEVLSRLADEMHTTKAEVLRKALGLIDFVRTNQSGGWTLLMEHAKNKTRKQIVSL